MTFHRVFAATLSFLVLITHGSSGVVNAQTPGLVEFFASGKLRQGLPLVDLRTKWW